jgi:ferrous iron transport protein A
MTPLSELKPGQVATVVSVAGDAALIQRLAELGLLEGDTVEFLATAPLGDPIEVRVGDTRLSLRKADATRISVSPR